MPSDDLDDDGMLIRLVLIGALLLILFGGFECGIRIESRPSTPAAEVPHG